MADQDGAGDVLQTAIAGYIRAYLASDDERLEWVRTAVRKHDFLPLYLGWIAVLGIRPDGTVVRWNHEDEHGGDADNAVPEPENNPYWQRMALARGAKRYPAVAGLVPSRPDEAITCGVCEGTGELPGVEDLEMDLICECGGLGWLLEGEPRANSPG